MGLLVILLVRDLWQSHRQQVGRKSAAPSAKQLHSGMVATLLALILIPLAILLTANLEDPEAMGDVVDPIPWSTVGLLYLSMLIGIAAQYFFFASEQQVFRWRPFIKPFLASPVLFIPLASSYQDALHSFESFSMADLMMLLAAFQNGFFWKIVFDRIAGEQAEAAS